MRSLFVIIYRVLSLQTGVSCHRLKDSKNHCSDLAFDVVTPVRMCVARKFEMQALTCGICFSQQTSEAQEARDALLAGVLALGGECVLLRHVAATCSKCLFSRSLIEAAASWPTRRAVRLSASTLGIESSGIVVDMVQPANIGPHAPRMYRVLDTAVRLLNANMHAGHSMSNCILNINFVHECRVWCQTKASAPMLLAVPVGPDYIHWKVMMSEDRWQESWELHH